MAKDFSLSNAKTLGLRNNNPGNLRPLGRNTMWVGQTGTNKGFVVFKNISYGIRAIVKNALTQIYKRGNNTVAKYITAYAPPHENDTAKYIRDTAAALGVKANDKIPTDTDSLLKLTRLHLKKEIGSENQYITDEDIYRGMALLNES